MPIPDHNLPDNYLREIGRVAVEWSRLEAAIETAIWTLTFTAEYGNAPAFNDQPGRAITTHVNVLLRIDMMLTLANVRVSHSPQYQQPLAALAARIRVAYPKRNRIVHGLWEATERGAFRQTYRARGEVAAWFEFISSISIAETANEIANLTIDLQTFIDDLTELYLVRIPKYLEPDPQGYDRPPRRGRTNGNKPPRPKQS